MKSLTKIQKNEIKSLYKFMQAHNELPNYKS